MKNSEKPLGMRRPKYTICGCDARLSDITSNGETGETRTMDKARETISSLKMRKTTTKLQTVIKRRSSVRFLQITTFRKACEEMNASVKKKHTFLRNP
jgi:hypothetical protein